MADLVVVAEDEDLPFLFRRILGEHEVRWARGADEVLEMSRTRSPDLVILDVHGPESEDLSVLRVVREANPDQVVIVLTSYGTAQIAVEAIRHGAHDYLFKPFDVGQLQSMVAEALEVVASRQQAEPRPERPEPTLHGMIGTSPVMQDVYRMIGKAAPTSLTVLITGESGTGKELVARMLHEHSTRSDKPFMALNCAAIPEPLLESELFGYERGAFTGALHRKIGKLQVCDGGTLFLDEIGDMSSALQTKMLRVLQDGSFERIGGTETLHVDVRIIAATNRDLTELMRQGRFRDDLYYRLKVVPVHLPPLRERGDDILLLARHFLQQTREELARGEMSLHKDTAQLLRGYAWPGNVRELENVVRGAVLTCPGPEILPDHLGIASEATEEALASSPAAKGAELGDLMEPVFRRFLEDFAAGRKGTPFDQIEEVLIRRALMETAGNQSQAARLLGITRTTLRKRMQKHAIRITPQVE